MDFDNNEKELADIYWPDSKSTNLQQEETLKNILYKKVTWDITVAQIQRGFKKSAKQGYSEGQCSLAMCYYWGNGVEKDLNEAVHWYKKSAEQGHAGSQCILGTIYLNGTGVKKDLNKGVYWLKKSAESGLHLGQRALGFCYEKGIGVKKDLQKAQYWYQKSIDNGNELAKQDLNRFKNTR